MNLGKFFQAPTLTHFNSMLYLRANQVVGFY